MESVLERENALSTAYNNFSIPHSVSPSAYKSTIGVLINPNGIKWNNKKVKIMFLMVISPTELNYFQTFYESLLNILLDTDVLNSLNDVKNFNDFRNLFIEKHKLT